MDKSNEGDMPGEFQRGFRILLRPPCGGQAADRGISWKAGKVGLGGGNLPKWQVASASAPFGAKNAAPPGVWNPRHAKAFKINDLRLNDARATSFHFERIMRLATCLIPMNSRPSPEVLELPLPEGYRRCPGTGLER